MSDGKIYINSGARTLRLPSGDEGLYIDLCLEDLEEILKRFKEEDEEEKIKRPWINRKENKTYNNIRIFAIPKREVDEKTLYPYYLEIAKVQPKREK